MNMPPNSARVAKKKLAGESIRHLVWDSFDSRLGLIGLIQLTTDWHDCKGRKF